jgi:hypothetical protein
VLTEKFKGPYDVYDAHKRYIFRRATGNSGDGLCNGNCPIPGGDHRMNASTISCPKACPQIVRILDTVKNQQEGVLCGTEDCL